MLGDHPPHISPPSPGVRLTTATRWTRGELQPQHGQQAAVSKQAHMEWVGGELTEEGEIMTAFKSFYKKKQ